MTAPLVAPEIDLRDFPYMPLDVVRLRDSDLSALASGDGFRAAVILWCVSWHQVPASSLPDDDRILAQFAGFGRAVKEWLAVREDALRGFIKCDDGRFYHPVIAEKAKDAWAEKIAYRDRKEQRIAAAKSAADARWSRRESVDGAECNADLMRNASPAHDKENAERERERERESNREEEPSLSETASPPRAKTKPSEDFLEFWKAYPTDPIMSLKQALAQWNKLTPEDRHAARAAVPAFAAHCRANPDYRPVHACRFLAQRRFDGFALAPAAVEHIGIFVPHGSPAWQAWDAHGRQTRGRGYPTTERNGVKGWHFPTEFPEQRGAA